ncbi:prolipoprotein diacylglyceryl transferase [Marivirga harenae]|uniref:prolipoprotein diacylglyceryl transferase n=1 Tax=Marivirga harenae TaxID=2010992 RepID=UPI0026E087C0|nr:prolipoprotein diacylglyceryl transferase [Marivirga harenae]WKV10847.1 prolipoprotein diacylglyceryl transferase [Marivirga harenae]|tara:strand:+ start:125199 stop:126281 length:1083 start_codon:yes stop_codon:yes gene_type:complete
MLSYIVWSPKPYILDLGFTELRWYGLLFALGFIISQQIMFYIFKKEGKKERQVEVLTLYMVVATIIGARLGHVLFYEPVRYLSNPLDILKIWEGGLASHGGAAGILIALYLFSRKYQDISYLWILDRIVIVVAITGALIRTGNFMNSEIIGSPTDKSFGVVFGREVELRLSYLASAIEDVEIESVSKSKLIEGSLESEFEHPVKLIVAYNDKNKLEDVKRFSETQLLNKLQEDNIRQHVKFSKNTEFDYNQKGGFIYVTTYGDGVPRHASQLYEAISCLLIFLLLFYLWNKNRSGLADGRLFGIFLIACFGLRFLYEFIKENQVAFEDGLVLNMGQWLSIPLVLAGFYFIFQSFKAEKGI